MGIIAITGIIYNGKPPSRVHECDSNLGPIDL